MNGMMPSVLKNAYTISITILAVASIILSVLDITGKISLSSSPYRQLDITILLLFTADYAVRFYKSEDRKKFFKENIPDLLAIIPFSSMFSAFRVFRVFRIAKASRLLKLTRLLRAGALTAKIRRRIFRSTKNKRTCVSALCQRCFDPSSVRYHDVY